MPGWHVLPIKNVENDRLSSNMLTLCWQFGRFVLDTNLPDPLLIYRKAQNGLEEGTAFFAVYYLFSIFSCSVLVLFH